MAKRASFVDRVLCVMDRHGMASSETPVLLMVSGGSDSTALAYLAADLVAAGRLETVAMLHVNHRLRKEASDADALFVSRLAGHLGFPLFVREINIPEIMRRSGGNMEAVSRDERYRVAREVLEGMCFHVGRSLEDGCIFTAHTADDRIENFYMRSLVGTGPGGFRSMRHSVVLEGCRVCHPLLEEGRECLRAYITGRKGSVVADEAGSLWREDATNADTDRLRAFVRHEIIPLAKQRNPRLLEVLTRTMNLIAEEDDMLEAKVCELLSAYVELLGAVSADGVLIGPELCSWDAPLARRVLYKLLSSMLPLGDRVEAASVEACMAALGVSGYVANIQGNLAVSWNKHGLRIEPMSAFRARRKPQSAPPI